LDTVVPEADFVEVTTGDLKDKDEAKQGKIVKSSTKAMSKGAHHVPEVPKDEDAYEKKVTEEQKEAVSRSSKALEDSAKGDVWNSESLHLRKDHEGSLSPVSPWNKAEAQTRAAGDAAAQVLKKNFAREKQDKELAKEQKAAAAQLKKRDHKMKVGIARQAVWDEVAKLKADRAAAKARQDAKDAKYDTSNNKKWIARLKASGDPDLQTAGKRAQAALEKAQADILKKALKPRPASKGRHTDRPPLPKVTPNAVAMGAAEHAMKHLNADTKAKASKLMHK